MVPVIGQATDRNGGAANGVSRTRSPMSKSALLRGDDPLTLTTFQDLSEQLWTEGS